MRSFLKKSVKAGALLVLVSTVLLFTIGCTDGDVECEKSINAAERGLSPNDSGEKNSRILQALIDEASSERKTVYIPAGVYKFTANGTQTIGSHCIKMRSEVSIVGEGEDTVLMPVGNSLYGLDMFYYNEYLDTGEAKYLENCRFESFVIDARETSCEVYTSAGKGFMFNLFKNCHFKNVTVKNTDATGFGVDCPIDSTISDCIAIGCGKAASVEDGGASGFGIGFGYISDESIVVSDCVSSENKKFGFFFEHQGRFDSARYKAEEFGCFTVKNCRSSGDLFGFGGINAQNTSYEDCVSENAERFGFYFENSFACQVRCGESTGAGEACFSFSQTEKIPDCKDGICVLECVGKDSPVGVIMTSRGFDMPKPKIENCTFTCVSNKYVTTEK